MSWGREQAIPTRRKRAMAEEKSSVIVVFVALNSPRKPAPEEVFALLQDKYAVDPEPEIAAPEGRDTATFFNLPDGMAFYSLMPAPIPWDSLEGPCSTARWWPDAEKKLRNHTHHFIVSLMGGPENLLERHVWLSKFVAALTESSDAAGVYWGNGTLVHSPEAFCQLAEAVSTDDPIPQLWIDMRIWQEEDRKIRFATTGLAAFDLLEIEVDGATWHPGELLEFCANLASYLIKRGSSIPDGDTLGRSAEEKFKVHHKKSMWKRPGKVMKLAIP